MLTQAMFRHLTNQAPELSGTLWLRCMHGGMLVCQLSFTGEALPDVSLQELQAPGKEENRSTSGSFTYRR
jgi:hypothetical protein